MFIVLLGPDFAGKSTVLGRLRRAGWSCVSYDDESLTEDRRLVAELRDGFLARALTGPFSADFVVTILQTAVVHLRDEAVRPRTGPVVVDSYYYKILAKCQLTGLVNDALLGWWRTFPKPDRVVYLDTDPAEAWRRSGYGKRLNRFEHYGDTPTWDGFLRFQTDLRERMLAEVDGLPVHVVAQGDPDTAIGALTGSDDVHSSAA